MATREEALQQAQPLSHRSANDVQDTLSVAVSASPTHAHPQPSSPAPAASPNAHGVSGGDDDTWTNLGTGTVQLSEHDWAGATNIDWTHTQTHTLDPGTISHSSPQTHGEGEEEGSEYETDDGADDELIVIGRDSAAGPGLDADALDHALAASGNYATALPSAQSEGRIYQHPHCRPIAKVGNTEIGLSQAKLFGLLDENGELRLRMPGSSDEPPRPRQETLKVLAALSKPREVDLQDFVDEEAAELTFKPVKNKASEGEEDGF